MVVPAWPARGSGRTGPGRRRIIMRVWVVEDQRAGAEGALAALLRALAERNGSEVQLLGAGPATAATLDWLRGQAPDVLVAAEPAWPEGGGAAGLLALGTGVVFATTADRAARPRAAAEHHPVVLVPANPTAETLWLGLLGAWAARQRQQDGRDQLARLQQRLDDRILVERAKGILAQRLHISEAEAYNRLRVLSRRQRRPMRDVAQSFLDTQDLLVPGGNDPAPADEDIAPNGAGAALPR
jgi:hypothetical protein